MQKETFNSFTELCRKTANQKIYVQMAGRAGYFVPVTKGALRKVAAGMAKNMDTFGGIIQHSPDGVTAKITLN